jgi:hypothetical protein
MTRLTRGRRVPLQARPWVVWARTHLEPHEDGRAYMTAGSGMRRRSGRIGRPPTRATIAESDCRNVSDEEAKTEEASGFPPATSTAAQTEQATAPVGSYQ